MEPSNETSFKVQQLNNFSYLEEGDGPVILLLHGLFGALSNFHELINTFSSNYKVLVPILPIYEMHYREASITKLLEYIEAFVEELNITQFTLLGNSLGGHIALLYAIKHQSKLKGLVLTGSSGLFENALGDTFPKRKDYEYIRKKAELTFFNPEMATKELVDELFEIVTNREKALCVVAVAKTAIRHNIKDQLNQINTPTLLIWGKQDQITPPFVADEFNTRLPNSELVWIDQCGHAPMMESPSKFNDALLAFMNKLYLKQS